jgi:hypothetical protein
MTIHRRFPADCNNCRERPTRSNTGLCFQCRPAPSVTLNGNIVTVGNGFNMSADHALVVAHKIIALLTP